MPLYVRDDDVDALAVKLQKLTKVRSKTEAVRLALEHEIERSRASVPLRGRPPQTSSRIPRPHLTSSRSPADWSMTLRLRLPPKTS